MNRSCLVNVLYFLFTIYFGKTNNIYNKNLGNCLFVDMYKKILNTKTNYFQTFSMTIT